MFKFGERSLANLETCDERLQNIAHEVLWHSPYDFAIIEGHRPVERQQELYEKGMTQIDGVAEKGKHNHDPSLAFDFMPYPTVINGINVWKDRQRFIVLAGMFLWVGNQFDTPLRWGGDWDGDGNNADSNFLDLPHIEIDTERQERLI